MDAKDAHIAMQPDPRHEEVSQLSRLRTMSLVEGTTLLILVGIAMPLKYVGGYPIATKIVAPLHGLAFTVFVWMLIMTATAGRWRILEALGYFVAAHIPFGAFFVERRLQRKQARLQQAMPDAAEP